MEVLPDLSPGSIWTATPAADAEDLRFFAINWWMTARTRPPRCEEPQAFCLPPDTAVHVFLLADGRLRRRYEPRDE